MRHVAIALLLTAALLGCRKNDDPTISGASAPAYVVSTLAGTGTSGRADGPGGTATFTGPNQAALDAQGNLYYLLLTTGLFVLASALLYAGLPQVLRHETDEQLLSERLTLQRRVARGQPLPTDLLFAYQLGRSRQPRRLGYSDTLLLDEREQELVPFRQLTFRLDAGRGPEWLTLRQSLVERHDLRRVLLEVLLGALGLLLLGVVGLNRWVARRLWRPFGS
jgi:hypothetical protein